MPFYNYTCRNCGEKQRRMTAARDRDGPIPCNHCDMPALDREVGKDTPNQNYLRAADPTRLDLIKKRMEVETEMFGMPYDDREQHEAKLKELDKAIAKEERPSEAEDKPKFRTGQDITK